MADNTTENTYFPVVGIGASAGGLEAVTALIKQLPLNTGMAFILVQHLAPSHESMLAELLARETALPVIEIKDGMQVEPNHFYVIPPNTNLGILHGVLNLMPREVELGQHLPIDFFLRSLAKDLASHAIGVILSGSASDGVQGLMEIKAAGGITFAQDEDSAAYSSMPRNAVAAGCVDYVLPPHRIARELARIGQHPFLAISGTKQQETLSAEDDNLRKIFLLLRQHTNTDFTYYKQSTILRRIKRRILLHKLTRMDEYVRYLQETPNEVDALFRDLLINVTSFFRDEEAFDELKDMVFPAITKGKPTDQAIRIWVPGCSTGEEVYSIAICLFEYLGDLAANTKIQFFATDLDGHAVDKARSGIYQDTIVNTVSAKRLQRFFNKVEEGYQIAKHVRDVCIFAQQNVFKDPPFSRMDMISCRNLLIYLSPILQQKVMPIFHYALNNNGYLMLGTSETIGRYADLFRIVDKKNKIYQKKSAPLQLSADFAKSGLVEKWENTKLIQPPANWSNFDIQREADRIVLKKYSPPGVVINEDMDVVQFRGHTGAFLEPAAGDANLNLLRMARNGLQVGLRNAIHFVIENNISARKEGLRITHNSDMKTINIEVDPILGPPNSSRYFLVSFQENKIDVLQQDSEQAEHDESISTVESRENLRLKEELSATQEYMHSIIEQQEVINEELTSANEEIQASNEELQSTNEELETAKEELQSSNEELATVNDEMESRNTELENLSNDLSNLIAGLSIPIVMVNNDLSIRRFSPAAEKLLNLIPPDVGRPITHIKANIIVPQLEETLLKVIDTVTSEKMELQDKAGYWYTVNIRPYKTQDNKINGAVVAFIDINEMKNSLDSAEWSKNYAEAIIAAIRYPLLVLDKNLRVISASEMFYNTFHTQEKDTIGNLLYHLGNGQWGIPKLRHKLEETITEQKNFDDFLVEHDFENIGIRRMRISGRPIVSVSNSDAVVLMQIEDISDTA